VTGELVGRHSSIFCHTAIENLSDPIGYLLDFTNPYYMALAGNMKACAKITHFEIIRNQDGDPQVCCWFNK
jgi:hypothetical protein